MQDKLLLLHQFLSELMNISDEDRLAQLSGSYKNKLGADREDDIIYKLWDDAQSLGREILSLKAGEADASRNKRIAALSPEEKDQLAETEKIIDENLFGYHFQPIVNTADGGIYSYEALMRPVSNMGLSPFHILKYAGLTGRLIDIERATFLNVLNIIGSNKEKFGDRKVFINSIPGTRLSGDDQRRVMELLVTHSDTVVVELTEQDEADEHEFSALKERCTNMGIKIAVDDYGTGYSNVSNLLRYMPDYVKIDRSLLSDIQNSPRKRHFVREIIEFCHSCNIMALAEGVETSEELHAVILLGADLIQGYYTSRPSAEVIDSIPYEIRQEIKVYQQERQDGRDQQIYAANSTERILLDRLARDGYECILAGTDHIENGEITIVGSPSLDTDIHIETAKDFKGRIVFENVRLSNVKNRPCIDLGENSDVTLLLRGENALNKGGIRVPEGARLALEGEGNLNITLDHPEYFGIGNDNSSRHGELDFDQSGTVTVTANGSAGSGIGSGLGGNITIHQGRYFLNLSGDTGVGMGALYADAKLDVFNCDFNTDITLAKGVAIGSVSGNADVHFHGSSAKLYMGGAELTALGTIDGAEAKVVINSAIANIDIRAPKCTCAGALHGKSDVTVDGAAFRTTVGGWESLPFGGTSGDTRVTLLNADTTVKIETDLDINKYVSSEKIEVINGRTTFTNKDIEIDLKK